MAIVYIIINSCSYITYSLVPTNIEKKYFATLFTGHLGTTLIIPDENSREIKSASRKLTDSTAHDYHYCQRLIIVE